MKSTDERSALSSLLQTYSAEVTARDKKGIEAAPELMAKGAEVFVANLPNDDFDKLVTACAAIRKSGLTPVPHMVARNTRDLKELDEVFARLKGEAASTAAWCWPATATSRWASSIPPSRSSSPA
ncbi:MAG: hypothetical protein WDM92_01820 [Caulobacteraceae bacterium]